MRRALLLSLSLLYSFVHLRAQIVPFTSYVNIDFYQNNEFGDSIPYRFNQDSTALSVCMMSNNENLYKSDSLVIPDSITYDGNIYPVKAVSWFAFLACPEYVKSITLPTPFEGIDTRGSEKIRGISPSIYTNTFITSYGLKKVLISGDNEYFTTVENSLYSKNRDILVCYPGGIEQDTVILHSPLRELKPNSILNKHIRFLQFPNTLHTIGNWAITEANLNSLVIGDSVSSIGYGAFYDCTIDRLVLGKGLKEVDSLFLMQQSVADVYLYAKTPPNAILSEAESQPAPNAVSNTLIKYRLFVPRQSLNAYLSNDYWSKFAQILPIEPPIVETADGAVVSWVQNFSATGYVWHLYKDDAHTQLVMSLTFDANGHLTHIELGNLSSAPSRMQTMLNDDDDDEPQQRFAEYYSFTISSLQSNTTYYYSRQSLAGDEVIDEEIGSFKTLTDQTTRFDNAQQSNGQTTKDLRDGQLIITAPSGKQYTPSGVEVR